MPENPPTVKGANPAERPQRSSRPPVERFDEEATRVDPPRAPPTFAKTLVTSTKPGLGLDEVRRCAVCDRAECPVLRLAKEREAWYESVTKMRAAVDHRLETQETLDKVEDRFTQLTEALNSAAEVCAARAINWRSRAIAAELFTNSLLLFKQAHTACGGRVGYDLGGSKLACLGCRVTKPLALPAPRKPEEPND